METNGDRIMKKKKPVEVFTDGSLSINRGAYGVLMMFGDKSKEIESKTYKNTTIARMELKAIIHSLEALTPGFQIYLYSDAKNLIDIINVTMNLWIETGALDCKSSAGLWKRFLRAKRKHLEGGSIIHFCWIRGHTGNKFNERVDKIAKKSLLNRKKTECKDLN